MKSFNVGDVVTTRASKVTERSFAFGPFLGQFGRDRSGFWAWLQVTLGRLSFTFELVSPLGPDDEAIEGEGLH